jgi:hypothetical protein
VPGVATATERFDIVIEIGGLPVRLCAADPSFIRLLDTRYSGFVISSPRAVRFEFEIDLAAPGPISKDDDVRVRWDSDRWSLDRGDFHAEWNPLSGRGRIRQTANPYSIDSVLRIVHTLLLAKQGGFLLHASSAVINDRAFLFAGISGAGKTTMAKLAPPNAKVLTDEVSYVSRRAGQYSAFGTPFAGELARVGENLCAPVGVVYLLAKGAENKIEPVEKGEAGRALLEHILFFAQDAAMVKLVFHAACDFVDRVPVCRLTFVPGARVWDLIG